MDGLRWDQIQTKSRGSFSSPEKHWSELVFGEVPDSGRSDADWQGVVVLNRDVGKNIERQDGEEENKNYVVDGEGPGSSLGGGDAGLDLGEFLEENNARDEHVNGLTHRADGVR